MDDTPKSQHLLRLVTLDTSTFAEKMNILIVGATSGIGYELWRNYAKDGNNVIVLGRRNDILEQMYEERRDYTYPFQTDINDVNKCTCILEHVFKEYFPLDLIIISAGTGDINKNLDYETELPAINTNVVAWTNVVDRSYQYFNDEGRGHLVTITSVGGLTGAADAPAYSATKAYQIIYTKSLQKKSKGTDICVTEIRPGLVNTAMAKGDGLFWVMPVQKVSRQIISAIKKRERLRVVTRRWAVISFILKHF